MKKRLGDVLIDCRLITEDDLMMALKMQRELKMRLGETLIAMELVTMDDIIWALGDQLNISYIHLNDNIVDFQFASLFDSDKLLQYSFLPIFKVGDTVTLVMSDPLDYDAIAAIKEIVGDQIVISVSMPDEIEHYIDKIYSISSPSEGNTFYGVIKNVLKNEVVVEIETYGFLKIPKDRVQLKLRPGKKIKFKLQEVK